MTRAQSDSLARHARLRMAPLNDGRLFLFAADESTGIAKDAPHAFQVLIVEDDYLVASDLESALLDAGIEVAGVAASAEEAKNLAEAHAPSVVLMDIRLAGKRDGIDRLKFRCTPIGGGN